MSSPAHEPIVSGRSYEITDIGGTAPTSLDDFVTGSAALVTITLAGGDHPYLAHGSAVRDGEGVHFFEKDAAVGKDTRVWRITQDGDGFHAVHDPRF
ncbi:hypothetical protein CLV92_10847 [Kineococcus xinjiangensis]|uniref:Uncharacterized protein n=1 Tax=Kineococcus xinjiangensis TaxID=512762 RepID=A0A2S6IIV6_9ACTN|nr:hypothetical protein [Kineococcus xinjiangensis]PPK94149.1 hypothetical protein CLV92_10847 [Kineococcus xinjiangensis]